MRILILSDIHANLTALKAVLDTAKDYDTVWCLGDLVGYGPDPNECIEEVRPLPNLVCMLGNHDAAALGYIDLVAFNQEARQSATWVRSMLSRDSLRFLENLPEKRIYGQVTLVHGSPRNPVWEYLMDRYTVAVNFNSFTGNLCCVGHTHVPVAYTYRNGNTQIEWQVLKSGDIYTIDGRAILNPGSVGQPRDRDPRAAYAIYDTEALTWEAKRVAYDIASVQERIEKAGLPMRNAMRLSEGW
jgi:predicted phosphodiesterase